MKNNYINMKMTLGDMIGLDMEQLKVLLESHSRETLIIIKIK